MPPHTKPQHSPKPYREYRFWENLFPTYEKLRGRGLLVKECVAWMLGKGLIGPEDEQDAIKRFPQMGALRRKKQPHD